MATRVIRATTSDRRPKTSDFSPAKKPRSSGKAQRNATPRDPRGHAERDDSPADPWRFRGPVVAQHLGRGDLGALRVHCGGVWLRESFG
jgi:hypothetical protein